MGKFRAASNHQIIVFLLIIDRHMGRYIDRKKSAKSEPLLFIAKFFSYEKPNTVEWLIFPCDNFP